eukprot:GFUD01015480.1.p1 GENE.GFUD01015480.1~~GFUD01015480.1.p1  ORF type:complete len:309 (+),score=86.48 GFUD01015480.1:62-988(+)
MRNLMQLSTLQRLTPVSYQFPLIKQLHISRTVSKPNDSSLVLSSTSNQVTTLTMNQPSKCNSWSVSMLDMLYHMLDKCAKDENTKVVILTGTDPYYSSGGNISGYMKLQHPKKFHSMIAKNNYKMFDTFISFPKPILIAANGPAIGGAVTSATLCDGILASRRATFMTPFSRMCVPPEGCSSVQFQKIMGEEKARKMLDDCWVVRADDAKDIGLVMEVVEHDRLMEAAQAMAEQWVVEHKKREIMGGGSKEEYSELNAKESVAVADAFLSSQFLNAQYQMLRERGKLGSAGIFWSLKSLRPLWSRVLK